MIVIEVLFDLVFSLALTQVNRLIYNASCSYFLIGKELQRNLFIVLLVVFVNLVPQGHSLSFPTPKLGRGER